MQNKRRLSQENSFSMNISIATVFPDLYREFLQTSLIKRSQEKEIVSFDVVSFASFCQPKERLDGPTVGHGSGMAIRPEVIERMVNGQEEKHGSAYKIFLTPQGRKLDQKLAVELSSLFLKNSHIMLVAGRYEGCDDRAQSEYADLEVSIGDYVLMGGDLPAMVLLETVMRHIPGVVAKEDSIEQDSFMGPFLDFPTYTVPPREWKGRQVPEVLLSGNHAAMNAFRKEKAVSRSVKEHFGWVRARCIKKDDKKLAYASMPAHYVVLMHDHVLVQDGVVGTSSVTSLDIHDIARSCSTYGIKGYALVTPLVDQRKIVETILDFWHGAGIQYNNNRAEAVELVSLEESLEKVIAAIESKEGKKPLLVATSAKMQEGVPSITYYDQTTVWKEDRPVLFIFGTAKGLSSELIKSCDYLLLPIGGFTEFKHLSVRSAVAVVLDRWMGINLSRVD